MATSYIELLQQIAVVGEVDADKAVVFADFGYALQTELIEGVEAQPLRTSAGEVRIEILIEHLLDEPVLGLRHCAL